jgi:hypothetical protein
LKMNKKLCPMLLCAVTIIALSPSALAQLSWRDDLIAELVANPDRLDDFVNNLLANEILAAGSGRVTEERLIIRRSDVQTGASNGSSGSTSVISSPLLPSIFGFSFENGGITRSVTGSTITIRANPANLICASGTDAPAVARRNAETCKTFWKRVGITASFDTSRGEKSDDLQNLQTLKNQFSELGIRFEVVNLRKVTDKSYLPRLMKVVAPQDGNQFTAEMRDLHKAPLYARLKPQITEALKAVIASPRYKALANTHSGNRSQNDAISDALEKYQEEISAAFRKESLPEVIRILGQENANTFSADRARQDAIENAPIFTIEYGFQQPDVATSATENSLVPAGLRPPNLHTVRAIYAQGITDRRLDFTLNASACWFQEQRPGMNGLFRDFRAGGQVTFRLKEIPNYGVPTLTFAGLYAYLHQRPLGLGIDAFNGAQIDEPGHIGLFQAKVELPTMKNEVRIPISFTASNRTELIKESDVRGQIGISFNLDSLFAEAK